MKTNWARAAVSRRALLSLLGATTAGALVKGIPAAARPPAVSRDGLSLPFQARLPQVVRDQPGLYEARMAASVSKLSAAVRAAVLSQPWVGSPSGLEVRLVEFLAAATGNATALHPARPMTTATQATSPITYAPFAEARQLAVLSDRTYFDLPLGARSILVVCSWDDPARKVEFPALRTRIEEAIPPVDAFLRYRYSEPHLNIQIGTGRTGQAVGVNIYLFAVQIKESISHEFVHNCQWTDAAVPRNGQWGRSPYPIWFLEGLADIGRYLLYGSSGYGSFSTGAKVNLEATALSGDEYSREGGNGFAFLKEVFEAIGQEAFSALCQLWLRALISGREIVDLMVAGSPADKRSAVQQIVAKWT